jgi:hypothetical protein
MSVLFEKRNGPEKDLGSRLSQFFSDTHYIYQLLSNPKEKRKQGLRLGAWPHTASRFVSNNLILQSIQNHKKTPPRKDATPTIARIRDVSHKSFFFPTPPRAAITVARKRIKAVRADPAARRA